MKQKVNKILLFILLIFILLPFGGSIKGVSAQSNRRVEVCYNGKSYFFTLPSEVYSGENFEIKRTYNERLKRTGLVTPISLYNTLIGYGLDESEAINYTLPSFERFYNMLQTEIEQDAVDSVVSFNPKQANMFTYSKSKSGIKINKSALINDLLSGKNKIYVKTITLQPKVSENDLINLTALRSKQSTSFANSEAGRRHNLLLAMSAFDGLVVEPGQEVHFNKVTGPRGAEQGYKDAIIIMNGKFERGIGGGACQASTTIYNAALTAGLEIKEVHRHTLPVGYCDKGFDAMINDYDVDMVFANNTNSPIYVHTYSANERVYCEIYGASLGDVHYVKQSEYVRDIEPEEPQIIADVDGKYADKIKYTGEFYTERYAKNGYEVKGYLLKYIGSTLVDKKLVRHEKYKPQRAIIYEGTMSKPYIYKENEN